MGVGSGVWGVVDVGGVEEVVGSVGVDIFGLVVVGGEAWTVGDGGR